MGLKGRFAEILAAKNEEIVEAWLALQLKSGKKMSAAERQETSRQSREFLEALTRGAKRGSLDDLSGEDWSPVRDFLTDFSAGRAKSG